MSSSRISSFVFSVPKSTSSSDGNEDRARVNEDVSRLAVADGATWGVSSAQWAEALVVGWVEGNTPARQEPVSVWMSFERDAFKSEMDSKGGGEWWSAASVDRGASSTFLGVEFGAGTDRIPFRIAAVGDTCAIQISETRRQSFPVATADGFGSRPELVHTSEAMSASAVAVSGGTLGSGEVLIFATDAIAKFLLEISDPSKALKWVHSLTGPLFEIDVNRFRAEGLLDDDDSTLVRISVDESNF